jgi:hypothetical protein
MGQRLVTSPNILWQFRNQLPFGLAVVTTANAEPLNQTDLSDGTTIVYLLEGADLADFATLFQSGN